MPTPISISSSPIWNVGWPPAGMVQEVSATPMERVAFGDGAEALDERDCTGVSLAAF
jgi:hypothetical protein